MLARVALIPQLKGRGVIADNCTVEIKKTETETEKKNRIVLNILA